MVSIELLRRYPFFAGFTHSQIEDLAKVAREITVVPNYGFIAEGERVTNFFLVLKGSVGISIRIPNREIEQSLTRQITNNLITKDITVSSVGEGEIFGWSAIIPPNLSTASAKSLTSCQVLEFDYQKLLPIIDGDCCFGHLLTVKAAQIIRDRFRDLRLESLAEYAL
ncbi:MAG: cyclic nucleotide-binding domain-containing protein [Chloroflexota bacterium]|nr:MAG: cyclic nucleotide-binding domain-containing protein [Chloroflexota bacterium]